MTEPKDEVMVKAFDETPVVPGRARAAAKVKSGMIDVPEIAALSVSGAALLGVILSYFFLLSPARDEFKRREAERSAAQSQFLNLQEQKFLTRNKEAGTVDLVTSLERFETSHLMLPSQGNAALYQRLNELIRANGLRNTAGPEYAPLEVIDATRASKMEERNRQQSLYPGTAVSVTVEGSYANLRKFINSLEGTRQFVIINAVEIESNTDGGAENNNPQPDPNNPTMMPNQIPPQMNPNKINPRAGENYGIPSDQPAAQPQNKRGAVSMRLEMAAYFRRQPEVQN
jgi:Tfp pilus assembly protein PilO